MKHTSIEARLSEIRSDVDRIGDKIEPIIDELKEDMTAEILSELRPVLELAYRHDPSLVDYHLRRLGVDPQDELRSVIGVWRAA